MKVIPIGFFFGVFLASILAAGLPALETAPAPLVLAQEAGTPTTAPTLVDPTLEVPAETPTQTPLPTSTVTPTPVPLKYAFGPRYFPDDINPLTGLPVADSGALDRRPIAIKIVNYPRNVRPQWGLNLADHVFEYYIGDQMTRFIGVFYSRDAARVGPVRSARLFDEHVMRMYNSYFVFGYADKRVRERLYVEELEPYLVIETRSNCPPICRYDNGLAYNNLFADTALLSQRLAERRGNNQPPDLTGLRFDLDIPNSGHVGEAFTIHFTYISYNRWQYDASMARYIRFQETADDYWHEADFAPLIDSMTDQQVYADNVVVLFTPHDIFYKSSSTEILDINFRGAGKGYAFRDGQLYPITWKQIDARQLIRLYLPNGQPYSLKPGNVWFEILSDISVFKPRPDGSWYFEFHKPEEEESEG